MMNILKGSVQRFKFRVSQLSPLRLITYLVILLLALGIDLFGALVLRDGSYRDANEAPVYYEATVHNTVLAKVTAVERDLEEESGTRRIYYFTAVLLRDPDMNEANYGYYNDTFAKGDVVTGIEIIDLTTAKKTLVPACGARIYLQPYRLGSYKLADGTSLPVDFVFSSSQYSYDRVGILVALIVIFAVLVIVLGGIQGFNTVLSLALVCGCLFYVFIPLVLRGQSIYLWSIMVCVYAIVTTIGLVVGPQKKALCAGLGNLLGVLFAGGLAALLIKALYITGNYDLNTNQLAILISANTGTNYDLSGIVFAATTIGSMGAVMDVAMSLASSLKEVYDNAKENSFKKTVRSGLVIGRDMMGTMANTLVLAYIGSSLAFLLYMMGYNYDSVIIRYEQISIAVIQAVVGSLGILVTIPFTAIVCGLVYNRHREKTVLSPAIMSAAHAMNEEARAREDTRKALEQGTMKEDG